MNGMFYIVFEFGADTEICCVLLYIRSFVGSVNHEFVCLFVWLVGYMYKCS